MYVKYTLMMKRMVFNQKCREIENGLRGNIKQTLCVRVDEQIHEL